MANWRKQQGYQSHYQRGHWRASSSYNRKSPLDNKDSTVPLWEREFCSVANRVPWEKVIKAKGSMFLDDKVTKWDDSAGKEAFDSAKMRYWAEINGFPCDIPKADPDIYIDNVDWNASVDPELLLDLEKEADFPSDEENSINQSFPIVVAGWGDDFDEEVTKPCEPNSAAQGWESNQHENYETNSWDQHCAPVVEHANKEYEWQNGQNDSQGWQNGQNDSQGWQNDSQGWNQREQYSGDFHNKFKGRNGGNWNGNWGPTWDGYNRKRENMSWSRNTGYYGNEYQMNRGRRNNRGGGGGGGGRGRGRRGNFGYERPYVDNAPTGAWY